VHFDYFKKGKQNYVIYVGYGHVEGPVWEGGMIHICWTAALKVQAVKFRKLVTQKEIFIIAFLALQTV
jgi:hypothetical protein